MNGEQCDICGAGTRRPGSRIVDGKTVHGPWAWMCEKCHSEVGVGFGTGKGQLFERSVTGELTKLKG